MYVIYRSTLECMQNYITTYTTHVVHKRKLEYALRIEQHMPLSITKEHTLVHWMQGTTHEWIQYKGVHWSAWCHMEDICLEVTGLQDKKPCMDHWMILSCKSLLVTGLKSLIPSNNNLPLSFLWFQYTYRSNVIIVFFCCYCFFLFYTKF